MVFRRFFAISDHEEAAGFPDRLLTCACIFSTALINSLFELWPVGNNGICGEPFFFVIISQGFWNDFRNVLD
jgi:hypothetical protein